MRVANEDNCLAVINPKLAKEWNYDRIGIWHLKNTDKIFAKRNNTWKRFCALNLNLYVIF